MDIQPLILAYAAAVVVALAVTASFSSSIEQVLFRLLPEEVAPHWARFIKFAAFVAAVGGGLPAPSPSSKRAMKRSSLNPTGRMEPCRTMSSRVGRAGS